MITGTRNANIIWHYFSHDLHGITAQSDCNRLVNDNTAAIADAYQCKKYEGMTDFD